MAQANQRIGEYLLDARIGGGAFGEVWKAHHHVWIDQFVAIKIPTDPQYLRNLQREGIAIHGLTHPNIVRAIGFDPYAPTPYLAMEYVPGSSLRPLIERRNLAIADAIAIMREVLSGLKYAHGQNLIHRDIKPENILVHERAATEGFGVEGLIKVTDFGLGKAAIAVAGSIALSGSMNSPEARDIAGTLDYMAPEQRCGAELDARVDLFAAGVVLYELLTGERPAGGELPSDLNPAVSKSLDEIFKKSCARLEKRFASADEFLAALSRLSPPPLPAGARTPPAMAPIPPQPPAPPSVAASSAPIGAGAPASCPQCRRQISAADQFCMHCGIQLVNAVRRCRRCGAYPDMTDRHCIFCGEAIDPPANRRV